MASQVYEFAVEMTCEGCANAVQNVLNKREGINNVKIDLEIQKVLVTATLSSDQVLDTIRKSGKTCRYIGIQP